MSATSLREMARLMSEFHSSRKSANPPSNQPRFREVNREVNREENEPQETTQGTTQCCLEQLVTASQNSRPFSAIEDIILGSLTLFPRISRSVHSHKNAVLLMERIRHGRPINKRSVIGTLLSSPTQDNGFVEMDLQKAGGVSSYLKKVYTDLPEEPEPTPSARAVTDVEANAIVRWFEHPEVSYHRSGTRTLTRRIQRTQLGTYLKYRRYLACGADSPTRVQRGRSSRPSDNTTKPRYHRKTGQSG